jgi:predicted 3-demethylubiquinone-9 3-methyltransferase (glyoxalase superfamily)
VGEAFCRRTKITLCGWLKDKYGLSWQIVPTVLGELMANKDARKSSKVMQAMLKMDKLDIKALKQASES